MLNAWRSPGRGFLPCMLDIRIGTVPELFLVRGATSWKLQFMKNWLVTSQECCISPGIDLRHPDVLRRMYLHLAFLTKLPSFSDKSDRRSHSSHDMMYRRRPAQMAGQTFYTYLLAGPLTMPSFRSPNLRPPTSSMLPLHFLLHSLFTNCQCQHCKQYGEC